jgi:hypothetical protein
VCLSWQCNNNIKSLSNTTTKNFKWAPKKELILNKLIWIIDEIYEFEMLFDSEEYDIIDRVPESQTYKQPKNLKQDLESQQQS